MNRLVVIAMCLDDVWASTGLPMFEAMAATATEAAP
jgi:hypothetical protein